MCTHFVHRVLLVAWKLATKTITCILFLHFCIHIIVALCTYIYILYANVNESQFSPVSLSLSHTHIQRHIYIILYICIYLKLAQCVLEFLTFSQFSKHTNCSVSFCLYFKLSYSKYICSGSLNFFNVLFYR